MDDTQKKSPEADYEGPLSPAGVAALKFAIVGMGVLIIVGLLLIVGRLIYLASQPKTPKQVLPGQVISGQVAPTSFKSDATVSLPPTARPIRTSVDGAQLSILYQLQSGQFGVTIVDLRSGQTLSTVTITSQAAKPDQNTK